MVFALAEGSFGECVSGMDGLMHAWMDTWIDRWMDGWMGRWMDRWIERVREEGSGREVGGGK